MKSLRRAALAAIFCVGCQSTTLPSKVTPVQLPEGGALQAGAVLKIGESWRPVVLSGDTIYARRESFWEKVSFGASARSLPESPDEQTLWMPCQGQIEGNFLSHNDRLWLMTRGVSNGSPQLWSVSGKGGTWREELLPLPFQRSRAARRSLAQDAQRILREDVCVFERDSQLFAMSHDRLWSLTEDPEARALVWQEMSLQGITDRLDVARRRQVPLVLRHYFPATEAFPFDVITVLGEQLQVYRRDVRRSRWVLVSVLPVIDLGMWRDPKSGRSMILTEKFLYKSPDQESWERIPVASREKQEEESSSLHVIQGEPNPLVFVGTRDGRILRSTDEGVSFDQVRARDRDMRSVHRLFSSPSMGDRSDLVLWGLTHGEGVLRGVDAGREWSKSNTGLMESKPTSLGKTGDDLVLGTHSGLFLAKDRRGEPLQWSAILDRSVTSTLSMADRVLVGTYGGAILSTSLSRSEQSFQELIPRERSRSGVLMLPDVAHDSAHAPRSIVMLEHRAQTSELFARSLGQSDWKSSNGGESWEEIPVDDALAEVLRGQRVTQWMTPSQDMTYVVSRASGLSGRTRLWSRKSGGVWRNVSTFEREAPGEMPMRIIALGAAELWQVSMQGVKMSRDGGASWRALDVELKGDIVSVSKTSNGALILCVSNEHARVVRLTRSGPNVDMEERELDLMSSRFEAQDVLEMSWMNTRVVFRTAHGLWEAPLYQKPPRQSRSIVLLLTLLVSMVAVAAAYLFVHGYKKTRRP